MENGYVHYPTPAYNNYQMMHLVPSCSSPISNSTFDVSNLSQLEFDLDLLPSLSDCVVPGSPSSPYYSSLDTHSTMFSPEPKAGPKGSGGYPLSPASSSLSPAPHSPYSPAGRSERRISTQSSHSVSSSLHEVDMSTINLQESLMEFTQLQDKIKMEQDMLLDSTNALTPLDYPPSTRYSINSDTYPFSPDSTNQSHEVKPEPLDLMEVKPPTQDSDNILLKQCLSDKSFQTKHNLKPVNFGFGLTGFVSDEGSSKLLEKPPVPPMPPMIPEKVKIEPEEEDNGHKPLKPTLSDLVKIDPLLDLAADQVRKEISTTCQILSISPNPRDWSKEDVKAWLTLTSQQSFIPMDILNLDSWNMDGAGLVSMTENDFKNRLPNKHGENLFTQFDIWRTNYTYDQGFNSCHGYQANMAPVVPRTCSQESQAFNVPPPPYPDTFWSPPEINQPGGDTFEDFAYMIQMMDNSTAAGQHVGAGRSHLVQSPPPPPPYPHPQTPGTPPVAPTTVAGPKCSSERSVDPMEDDEDEEEEEAEIERKSPTTRTGTNIHLWQFVKELLLQPQNYGNYIHWVDRQKGIFKIVDSVKVATLWGKRKNRPAMNYDKLSRSLRQYYKKGIMKKTERSQRLVYQFCHPYQL